MLMDVVKSLSEQRSSVNQGVKLQHQQWWIYVDEWTWLGQWGGGVVCVCVWWWRVSKQVAETWLILSVSCGHLSNYYLCCSTNLQSREANSGEKKKNLHPSSNTGLKYHR